MARFSPSPTRRCRSGLSRDVVGLAQRSHAALTAVAVLLAVSSPSFTQGLIPWPYPPEVANNLQATAAKDLGVEVERTVQLTDDVALTLVLIPPGDFVMGAADDESPLDPDESPTATVRIGKPFWLGTAEITNQQFACFDPEHNTGWMDTHGKDRVGPGVAMNAPEQPVARISCYTAEAFCGWLGEKLGATCRLPTEAEWEYACRSGADTPYHFGDEAEIAKYANIADASLGQLKPWALRDNEKNDGHVVSAPVGSLEPNAWGLHDMHGNVFEWTGTGYRAYPYADDGREDPGDSTRAVRGGSWDDRPRRARSAFRLSYAPTLAVYNVGFRVVVEAE